MQPLRTIPGADAFCIALILLPICIVPTVVSERFRPKVYAPAPERPAAIVKVQDRHN